MEPRKGALAFCGDGSLGLIIEEQPKEITYDDGTKGKAWCGIHLTDRTKKMGDPWSSRTPKVVGYIDEMEHFLRSYLGGSISCGCTQGLQSPSM